MNISGTQANAQNLMAILDAARARNGIAKAGPAVSPAAPSKGPGWIESLKQAVAAARVPESGHEGARGKVRPAVFPKVERPAPSQPQKAVGGRIDLMA